MQTRRAILIAALLSAVACDPAAQAPNTTTNQGQPEGCPREGVLFETAYLYIEHNATDADTGVHGLFGGEAWSELCIWDPSGELILSVQPKGSLGELAISDLFFESREPPNDEHPIETLTAAFPEGEYTVGGTDFEGVARVGTATFTHDIPAAPVIATPEVVEDEEEGAENLVEREGLVVSWEPVAETLTGDPVTITAYEVIVTKVDHEDPNGFSRPIYDVHVGPEVTALPVVMEFLEPDTLYELEVLAIEVSGNQTISLGFFTTSSS